MGLMNLVPLYVLLLLYQMVLITIDLTMPLPLQLTPTIEDHQLSLIQLKDDGFTNLELQEWLQRRGVTTPISTLERRLQLGGVRRRTRAEVTEELVGRVSHPFHHSLLTDSQIAGRITEDDGIPTSCNQVKVIRLKNGWLRRHNTPGVDRQATQSVI